MDRRVLSSSSDDKSGGGQQHRHAEEATARPAYNPSTGFNTNIVIITAAVLLVLVCALGMNSLVKRLLRCWEGRRVAEPAPSKGMQKKELCALPTILYRAAHPTKKVSADDPSTCPICLSEFTEGERLRPMPACQHLFHVGCVDTWLAKSSSCPTCRGAIAAGPPEDAKPPPPPSHQVQLQIVITTTPTLQPISITIPPSHAA